MKRLPKTFGPLILSVLLLTAVSGHLFANEPASPTLPVNLERLDPAVAAAIKRQAFKLKTRGGDLQTQGTLCLIYEANGLWEPARECLALVAQRAPENHIWRYHLALATRESGRSEEALAQMLELVRQYPDFAPLQQRLGEALLETGQVTRARLAFRRVIELMPGAAEGYTGLGDTLLREQQYLAAVEALEQAVRLDPNYRTSRYLLGMAYRGLGRSEDAVRELARGVDARPRYLPDELSTRVSQYRISSTARIDQGVGLLSAGRPAEAAEVFEQALSFEPDNHVLLNNLAIAYMQQGQLERAHQLLQRALQLNDKKFTTYLNLSSWALRNRQPEQALAYADTAIARADNLSQTHLARARSLVYLGRHEESIASLQTAVRLDSRNPQPFAMLGDQLARLGRLEQAEQIYRDALSISPEFLPAYLGLTRVYLNQDRLEDAAGVLRGAADIAPGHPAVTALTEQLEARR